MVKIIKGLKYSTETARLIGADGYKGPRSDFAWYRETLYQKKTGEYFLHGEGNARSIYATQVAQREYAPGEKITPLPFHAAQAWAEEHLSADAYEAEFGEIKEDDTATVLTLTMSASTAQRLKRGAAERGISIGDYIETLL